MDIIRHTHHTLASDFCASQHTLHTVLPNSLVCFSPVSRRFQRTTAYGPTYVPHTHLRPQYLNDFEVRQPYDFLSETVEEAFYHLFFLARM